jgi:PPP family 3-phenylpropionic acid transporter
MPPGHLDVDAVAGQGYRMKPYFRFSLFCAAFYSAFGVATPFLSVWLDYRGLTPSEIGLVFAVGMAAKVVFTLMAGQVADQVARKRDLIGLTLLLVIALMIALANSYSLGAILLLSAVATALQAAVVTVTDAVTLAAGRTHGLVYSQVRLWGSASFLVVALAMGPVLEATGPGPIIYTMAGLAVLGVIASRGLIDPPMEARPRPPGLRDMLMGFVILLRTRSLRRLYLTAALLQNSHLFYYAFSSLHWQKMGLSKDQIGLLWAEGVVFEIILFAIVPRVSILRRPVALLVVAGIAGIVRWCVLGATSDFTLLIFVQALHALTFGAAHLGAMQLLSECSPEGLSARAQGLYAALPMGIGSGLAYMLVGPLYGAFGGAGFYAMAGLSAAGLALAFGLRGRSDHAPQ